MKLHGINHQNNFLVQPEIFANRNKELLFIFN